MRPLVLVVWFFIVVLALFKLRVFFEHQLSGLQTSASGAVSPAAAVSFSKREADDYLLKFIRTWDFETFKKSVDPLVLQQIPEDSLKTLFQGVAYRLGPLVYYKGSRFQKKTASGAQPESQTMIAEAVFMKGEAVLELEVFPRDTALFLRRFSAESAELQDVEAAALEAYQSGRLNQALFRQKIAS